jgi:colanic acid biosynthesis glycosyl transferase WcaI
MGAGRFPQTSDEAPSVWVASELYYPEETSTGYVMTRIAEGLATRLPVRVLCAQPTYSARGTRAPGKETRAGVRIRRVWSTTWPNERMLARLANQITVTVSTSLYALFALRRRDRVLVVTDPPVLPYAMALVCLLRRAACVVLVQDSYPEVLVAAGVSREGSFLVRLLDLSNRLLYRFAARVVVVGRGMQERARAKLDSRHAGKVRVIRDWADTDLVHALPREGSELLRELGLSDKFVVQYAGNISRLNDIENLVEAIETFREEPRFHFLFVGRGGRREWLEREVERRGLENVTQIGWMPRSESPRMHRACDLVLVPLIPGMGGIAVPSRLYNSLASGRPIIAVTEAVSELARITSEESVGWVVPPGDPAALAAAIREAAADSGRLREMGARARRAAERRLSRDRVVGEWVALFAELDDRPASD